MATGVNNPQPVPSAATASSSSASAATPSVFIPPADTSIGTWLSLGSYEEVFNSDWDYWEVNKVLKGGGMTLVKILKIHNNLLKERFDEELSLIKKGRNSGFNPNIQDLYHGTSENLERICHEGLDERLSTNGHFGRGIYFSDNPAFCRIHSEGKSPTPKPYIVRCKVILGDSKIYPSGLSDPCLTREPVKEVISGKNFFFDSVQGNPGDFKQYIIYEKRRAFIQYVIYYTADGPLPSLPPIPSHTAKSTKKKRPKSKERKSSSSSCNKTTSTTAATTAPGPTSADNGATGTSVGATITGAGDTSTGAGATSAGAGATSTGAGATNPTTTDPSTDAYKKKVQENAMKQMLDLKGKLTNREMEELWRCFSQTYGGENPPDVQEFVSSVGGTLASSGADDVQLVMDVLVEQFRSVVGPVDPSLAHGYIAQFNMDVESAVNAYLDSI